MLAAASLLGGAGAGAGYTRQIVFLALAGEPWGYMGSRALLWELQRRGASVAGLDFGMVDQVRSGARSGTRSGAIRSAIWRYCGSQCRLRPGWCWRVLAREFAVSSRCIPARPRAQVLEIGPVGRSLLGAASPAQLYAHTQRGDGFGDASAVVEALQAAAAGLPAELQVRRVKENGHAGVACSSSAHACRKGLVPRGGALASPLKLFSSR